MNYAQGATSSANHIREMTLSDHLNSIDGHLTAASDILQRMGKVADQVGGSVPQDASMKGQIEPPMTGALTLQLKRKLLTLGEIHAAILSELGRLENAI